MPRTKGKQFVKLIAENDDAYALCQGETKIGGVNLKLVMEQPTRLVAGYNNIYELYRGDNKKVGEVGLKATNDYLYIYNFVIQTAHRRKGFAKLMIEEIVKVAKQKRCKKLKLMVLENNLPAIWLYEGSGFTLVGTKEKHRIYERKL